MALPSNINTLMDYLPNYYKSILETIELIKTEDLLFKDAVVRFSAFWLNQYILTADVQGVENYERLLNLIADPSIESLEFRKRRVINTLTLSLPFTRPFLRERLDFWAGEGNWQMDVDFDNHILTIKSAAEDSHWVNEIKNILIQMIPASLILTLVFINKTYSPLYISAVTSGGVSYITHTEFEQPQAKTHIAVVSSGGGTSSQTYAKYQNTITAESKVTAVTTSGTTNKTNTEGMI